MSKILLVEDDSFLREILQHQLEIKGHTVLIALNGKEGLRMIIQDKPDLVVADIIMPELSGFEMIEQMRGLGEVKDTPVIVVSALNQPEDRAKASALGVAAYISKGDTTPADSVKIIETVLTKPQSDQPLQPQSQRVDSEPPHL